MLPWSQSIAEHWETCRLVNDIRYTFCASYDTDEPDELLSFMYEFGEVSKNNHITLQDSYNDWFQLK